jgi:hypothetical protein
MYVHTYMCAHILYIYYTYTFIYRHIRFVIRTGIRIQNVANGEELYVLSRKR